MTNLSALLDILKKINENYEKKILTNESITEETENIEEICHKIKNEPEYIKELRKNALAIGNIKSTKKIIENMI